MNKYFVTKKNVYQITQREDGYVVFNPECENAGCLIACHGGIENFLAVCVDDERDYDEFVKDFHMLRKLRNEAKSLARAENAAIQEKRAEENYNRLLKDCDGIIPVTAENLTTVMKYLSYQNMGIWKLPRMSQGYSAHQYNCNGKTIVTIMLDKGIMSEGVLYKALQYGAPMGFLSKYAPVGRL